MNAEYHTIVAVLQVTQLCAQAFAIIFTKVHRFPGLARGLGL